MRFQQDSSAGLGLSFFFVLGLALLIVWWFA